MLKRLTLSLLFLLTLAAAPLRAQYYQLGADPSSTRWNRIRSDNFDVIYPVELDSLARVYLYSFERMRPIDIAGLGIESVKVPIVLHPYTMESNGTVVWAPKRAELITTPPSSALYALNWEQQLASHEGRHLGQMVHYTKGIYKLLGYLAGEQSIAIGVGFYPSRTFLEGDAVQNETDFSNTGRGRDPDFLKYYRAAFVNDDTRNYDRWRYGSYRYYVPNKYAFGYMISATYRNNSGNYYAAGDIMKEQVKSWWRVFSVSHRSYNYATGMTVRKNWKLAVKNRSALWKAEYESRAPYTGFESLLAKPEHMYSEFTNTTPAGDVTLSTMEGLWHTKHIVAIDSLGREHRMRPFSASTSSVVPDGDGFIFAETVPDPRWELRSWSNIRRYDFSSNRITDITRRTRFVNPTLSAGRDSILAIDYKVEGGSDGVIIDKASGELLGRIPAPEKGQMTGFVQLGDKYYASVITSEGMGLYSFEEGTWSRVIEPQSRMIRDLRPYGGSSLYFVSDLDGIYNVYMYDTAADSLSQLTTARFGTANPTIDEATGTLYYSDYDTKGYTPVKAALKDLDWKPASFSSPYRHALEDANSALADSIVTMPTAEEDAALWQQVSSLPAEKYGKFGHAINIHSWAPFYANINRIMDFSYEHIYQLASPGATLVSQNQLGTVVSTLGYGYHRGFHSGHLNLAYSGLYPVFELSVDFNDRYRNRTDVFAQDNIILSKEESLGTPSFETSALTYVPINLSSGGWSRGLVPQLQYAMNNDMAVVLGKSAPITQSLAYALRYYSVLPKSKSRLTPKWGLGVTATGATLFGPQDATGNIAGVDAYFYTPGFHPSQGFKFTAGYQKQFSERNFFSYMANIVSAPRGYDKEHYMDYYRVSADYAIPINLLDGGIPWFCYMKRIILIPFADYAVDRQHLLANGDGIIYGRGRAEYLSYGTAFLVNAYFCRIGTEIKIGFRYARTREGDNSWRIIFSTGL